MGSEDAQSTHVQLQENGPWGGSTREGYSKDNPMGRGGLLASSMCIPGESASQVGHGKGEARVAHLLLHQVQGQDSTVRQGRRWKSVVLAALPAQTLKVEGGPPMG